MLPIRYDPNTCMETFTRNCLAGFKGFFSMTMEQMVLSMRILAARLYMRLGHSSCSTLKSQLELDQQHPAAKTIRLACSIKRSH